MKLIVVHVPVFCQNIDTLYVNAYTLCLLHDSTLKRLENLNIDRVDLTHTTLNKCAPYVSGSCILSYQVLAIELTEG